MEIKVLEVQSLLSTVDQCEAPELERALVHHGEFKPEWSRDVFFGNDPACVETGCFHINDLETRPPITGCATGLVNRSNSSVVLF